MSWLTELILRIAALPAFPDVRLCADGPVAKHWESCLRLQLRGQRRLLTDFPSLCSRIITLPVQRVYRRDTRGTRDRMRIH